MIFLFVMICVIIFSSLFGTYLVYGQQIGEFKQKKGRNLKLPEFVREFNKFMYSCLYENIDKEGVFLLDAILSVECWIIYRINLLPEYKKKEPLRFFKKYE